MSFIFHHIISSLLFPLYYYSLSSCFCLFSTLHTWYPFSLSSAILSLLVPVSHLCCSLTIHLLIIFQDEDPCYHWLLLQNPFYSVLSSHSPSPSGPLYPPLPLFFL
ncbi:hypothetical protein AMECASPLE_018998 [Ameca splendens]|uniref:Uncharacterized protein n=1 Tax=Ameca splendens TaxID=208324 RepID=A0ABV0ZMP3_9TELE